MEEYLEESAAQRDLMLENSLRRFKLLEQKISGELDEEADIGKQQENAFMALVDEKIEDVNDELAKEVNTREEDVGCLKTSLEVKFFCSIFRMMFLRFKKQ